MRGMLHRAAAVVTRIEEVSLAWGILVVAASTVANVLGRTFFATSLPFAEELSRFAIVVVTFMGLGYAAARARHIRMTALHDALPPRFRKALLLVVTGSTALLLGALTVLACHYVFGTVRALGGVSPVLRVPRHVVYAVAPLGLGLAALQYALAFTRNLLRPELYVSWEVREDEAARDDAAIPASGV